MVQIYKKKIKKQISNQNNYISPTFSENVRNLSNIHVTLHNNRTTMK